MKIGDPIDLTVLNNRMVAIFYILTHLRYFWTENISFSLKIRQKLLQNFLLQLVKGSRGSEGRHRVFCMVFNDFSLKKCFCNLYRPISMRNFTGNPFLMVSERYGHAKLVKTSKNKFFGEIIDILEVDPHLESRSTPNPTAVYTSQYRRLDRSWGSS